MFDEFDDKQMIKILGVITFLSVFVALFVYFFLFPIKVNETVAPEKTVIGIDPIAFEIAKNWNNLNPNQTVIEIDSCNTATRINETTWQITMRNC